MKRDKVLAIAREVWGDDSGKPWSEAALVHLEAFAGLVEAAERERTQWDIHSCHQGCENPACVAVREAVAAEREACAALCDAHTNPNEDPLMPVGQYEGGCYITAEFLAGAIRARGNHG